MRRALDLLLHLSTLSAVAALAGTAAAEPVRAVVEMYTSQGCASCPPADRLVGELSRQAGVLALTVPVTYWDYLGWKDSLADPAFNERQRGYASMRRERSLSTPQAIINGTETMVGSDRAGIEHCVSDLRGRASALVGMAIEERGDRIVVDIEADSGGRQAEIWLVPVLRSRPVAIGRGENKGKVVVYTNVVRDLQRIGSWSGHAARFEVPREAARRGGADSYVIVLQNAAGGRPSRVLGAAKGPGL